MKIKVLTDDGTSHLVQMNLKDFEETVKYAEGNDFVKDVDGWRIVLNKIMKYKPESETDEQE